MPAMQSNPIQSKQSYFVTESMYVTCAAAGSYQYPFRKFGKVGKGRGWLWGSCARSARQWMAPKSKGGVGVRRGRLLVHAVYVDCSTPVTRGGRKGTNTQRRCLFRQVRQKASIAAQPARLYRQGWWVESSQADYRSLCTLFSSEVWEGALLSVCLSVRRSLGRWMIGVARLSPYLRSGTRIREAVWCGVCSVEPSWLHRAHKARTSLIRCPLRGLEKACCCTRRVGKWCWRRWCASVLPAGLPVVARRVLHVAYRALIREGGKGRRKDYYWNRQVWG